MTNKVTGYDKTYVVYCESIDMVEEVWHETHEEQTEYFEDHDTPKHWQFNAATMLDHCTECGGLKRPGPPGTGAILA